MCRATVIGNAGGGKSTLCKKLKESKQLPLYPVDKLQWNPGWTPVPPEQISEGIREIIKKEKWIIDGWGPWETIEERCEKSDTIILVDHRIWIHLWWAAKRQIKALFRPDSIEKPEGCDLVPMTWKMFKMIWIIHRDLRPKLVALVERYKETKVVYHIRSPRELNAFIAQHC
jgi:adenylate kinase family enzyme